MDARKVRRAREKRDVRRRAVESTTRARDRRDGVDIAIFVPPTTATTTTREDDDDARWTRRDGRWRDD